MTRHNLNEHLQWLLGSNCVPPNTSIATLPQSAPLRTTAVDPISELAFLAPSSSAPDLGVTTRGHASGVRGSSDFIRPAIPAHSEKTKEVIDMARLQSGPRSTTKARLLSRVSPDPLQLPTPRSAHSSRYSLADQYSAAYGESSKSTTATPSRRAKNESPLGEVEDHYAQTSSSSTIEVFGDSQQIWREDSASRIEPATKRGRKRKSEELDGSASHLTSNHHASAQRAASQSSFVAIDAYPDEDPPPYSTNPREANERQKSRKMKDLGFDENDILMDITDDFGTSEARSKNALRKVNVEPKLQVLKTPSKKQSSSQSTRKFEESSLAESIRKKDVNVFDNAKEDSGKVRSRKRIIADSEDEEEEASSREAHEYNTNVLTPAKLEVYETRYPSLPGTIVKSPKLSQPAPNIQKVTNSAKRVCDGKFDKPKLLENRSIASPYQHDSPTKVPSGFSRGKSMKIQVPSTLQEAHRQTSVQEFLDYPPHRIQAFRDGLHNSLSSKAEAGYHLFLQGKGGAEKVEKETMALTATIKNLDKLLALRTEHQELTRRKADIKDRMIAAIENDEMEGQAANLQETQSAIQRLSQVNQEMFQLLAKVSLPILNSNRAIPSVADRYELEVGNSQPTVIVHSTQAPGRGRDLDRPNHHLSRSQDPAPSQRISQTQIPSNGPSSPMRQAQTHVESVHASKKASVDAQLRPQMTAPKSPHTQRTPLRTYAPPTKPADVTAYFSPPKQFRGLRNEQENNRRDDRFDELDEFDEENFTTQMGSPLQSFMDEEEYGQDEDDDEMLEVAEQIDNCNSNLGSRAAPNQRIIFAETTGNASKGAPTKSIPRHVQTSSQALQLQYPWSRDVKIAMKERFHLQGFRPNQLEAINATLSGKDAFVLMPTGGGKSLCYQLPSIVQSGKSRGVTVVISPLLSLMQDQVDHLQKLKIQALLINSEVTLEHRRLVLEYLRAPHPEKFIQLLYITPEMISKSQAIVSAFCDLHRRNKLARLVIDEAHCVSQWGHDFRPDYKLIGDVRRQFEGVPVMALTATATENVKIDVIHNLGIQGCEIFTQSFNRPNLTYEVRDKSKGKEVLESMAQTINNLYKNQSGIIYCLSRNNCEKIAAELRNKHGIKAHHYHAGMDPPEKTAIQKQWQAGEYNVIVATIAFGMGIDKPDVRFVIHHSIPKSLEGYYQETGRAGRDGKRSGCFLYYGYQDTSSLKRMIDDGEGSWEQKERQRKMLRNIVQYCENRSDCRRVQVLNYFNETFRREDCNGACDNCNSTSKFESQDFTEHAIAAIDLVRKIEKDKVTLLHCVDVYRGGKNKKISDLNHYDLELYGRGSGLERGEIERLFYRLLSEDALVEVNVMNKANFASQYVHLGRNCNEFVRGRRKLKIQVRLSPKRKSELPKKSTKVKVAGISTSRREYPQSTNVSSPVQAAAQRRKGRAQKEDEDVLHRHGYRRDEFVVSDNDDPAFDDGDEEDDAFEPVRETAKSRSNMRGQLGPPITTDEKMDGLNETHRMVVEDFVINAKNECDKIMMSKNLSRQPFTNSILREMAINFTKDEDEMRQIPGIDVDKIDRYGKRFLKLIHAAHQGYETLMRQQEDRPQDPNHQNVIDISSDEEFGHDEYEDELGSQPERSSYFQADPEVEAFNARFSQIPTVRAAPAARSELQPHDARERGTSKAGRGKSWGKPRRTSKGGQKTSHASGKSRTSGGNSKKKANGSKNGVSNASGSSNQHRSAPSGFGGGGGIGMMPTKRP